MGAAGTPRTGVTTSGDPVVADGLAVARQAAQEAGALIRAAFQGPLTVQDKGHAGDIVTSLDTDAEDFLIDRIRARFPAHQVIGEERGAVGADSRWTWLIDPLDGTHNLVIGLPVVGVSLALLRDGLPVVAAIEDVFGAGTMVAVRGGGAAGAGGRLHLERDQRDGPLTVAWIEGHGARAMDESIVRREEAIARSVKRLLRLWAPTIAWGMLARGVIDAVVVARSGGTDLHSGWLLADEAGAIVRGLNGGDADPRFHGVDQPASIVAVRPGAEAAMRRVLSEG